MYKLIKIINGKEIVDTIDSLKIVNKRKKALINTYRGKKVTYRLEKCKEEKYRKPPHDGSYVSGGYRSNPKRVK